MAKRDLVQKLETIWQRHRVAHIFMIYRRVLDDSGCQDAAALFWRCYGGISRCALHRIGASSNVFFAGRPCPSTIHRQPLLRSSRADGRVISRAQCMLAHSTSTRSDAGAHAGGRAAGRAAGHAESALGGSIVCCSEHCVVSRELKRQGLRRTRGGSIVW